MALFDARTRRRLALAVIGSVVIALAEVVAVVAVLPLLELLTGGYDDAGRPSGALRVASDVFGDPPPSRLAAYVAATVFVGFLVKGLVSLAIRWWSLGFLLRQGVRTAEDLMRYYLTAPYSLHLRRGPADLLRTMNDAVGQVYSQVVMGGVTILTEAVTIVTLVVTLLVVNPLPTIAVAVYFAVAALLLQRLVRARAVRAGEDMIHAAYVTTQTGLQALGGVKEIKLRSEQEVFVRRYAAARQRAADALRTSSFLSDVPKYAMELLFVLGIALVTALVYAQDGSRSALASVALFAVAGFRVLPSIVRAMSALTSLRAGTGSLDLVEHDLDLARATERVPAERPERMRWSRGLTVQDVSFRYEGHDALVLDRVDLDIPAGSSLALVGSSGAGKTTLVDVLLGLHAPVSGRVLADGEDVRRDLAAWQQGLAMVPQEVYLFDESLRDNIRFSPDVDDPDDARLLEVIEQSRLGDLVRSLPDGVASSVGDRGQRLSGGQRQRVGIARALFRRPSLLVLDEATSALDNETEHEVIETVEALHGEVTLVVVAHRLSTVRHCDQIAFLKDGRVEGVGTFADLRRTVPDFERMVRLGRLDDERTSPSERSGTGERAS
ncbi:ABC transporter ATP-binding protein [Marmoricola endophyticus]|uniref:ABC transporter ATP-binding protein n=1 Tax=Marmoricola endophyticus TaxID=2040280 RepID=UPI001663C640|nr:ABC transporter ATP-binding protein [Marmoricola endophyticus]